MIYIYIYYLNIAHKAMSGKISAVLNTDFGLNKGNKNAPWLDAKRSNRSYSDQQRHNRKARGSMSAQTNQSVPHRDAKHKNGKRTGGAVGDRNDVACYDDATYNDVACYGDESNAAIASDSNGCDSKGHDMSCSSIAALSDETHWPILRKPVVLPNA